MKKILIITYYWPPSGGPGVQRWLKFVKFLTEFNITPIVLTVNPQKASYQIIDKSLTTEIPNNLEIYYTDTREPFNAYKKFTRKKEIPVSGFANESKPSFLQKVSRFIRGNFFIPDPRKGWNKFAYAKAVEIISKYKIDTVITTSPPHSTQLIGLKLKQNFNIKWIADLRDPWTNIYFYKELYHTKIAANIDKKLEHKVLQTADNIIVVSKDIKRIFAEKINKTFIDKIKIIPNGFDNSDFEKPVKKEQNFTITYTGTISDKYDISGFITALENIKLPDNFNIKIVGSVAGQIKSKLQNSTFAEKIEFINYQPHDKSIEYIKKSTILLLIIPKIENNKGILTGKLFEYLATKNPILNIGPVDGDAAEIITYCGAGKTFDYKDISGIQDFLSDNIANFDTNKNIKISNNKSEKYSRKNLTQELSKIINE